MVKRNRNENKNIAQCNNADVEEKMTVQVMLNDENTYYDTNNNYYANQRLIEFKALF